MNLRTPPSFSLSINSTILSREFDWLSQCIQQRINQMFNSEQTDIAVPLAPVLQPDWQETSSYVALLEQCQLNLNERKVLLLALLPELKPELLDVFLVQNTDVDRPFSEFGGHTDGRFSGFIPNYRTALFLLAGSALNTQIEVASLLDLGAPLFKNFILDEDNDDDSTLPFFHRRLRLADVTRCYLLSGNENPPLPRSGFPATPLTSSLSWSQLVLADTTKSQLIELLAWLELCDKNNQQASVLKKMSTGYRCLFYGPSGTGKTVTAALLGQQYQRPVYRVDLSQLVSKFIGETEKNLERIFVAAEQRHWILFFDEADALFSQRTSVSSANDKHANEQAAYLLQRLESSSAVIILATNFRENFDKAFIRRFQSMIHFPRPQPKQRAMLWESLFDQCWPLERSINLNDIAEKYDLSGGAINNVARYCTLMALKREQSVITLDNLIEGVHREYAKESRTP